MTQVTILTRNERWQLGFQSVVLGQVLALKKYLLEVSLAINTTHLAWDQADIFVQLKK